MTLEQLRKKVGPAIVDVDASGTVEIIAPDGYCFEHTLHALVTDAQMMDRDKDGNLVSQSKVYDEAYRDFGASVPRNRSGWLFQECAPNCSCKL